METIDTIQHMTSKEFTIYCNTEKLSILHNMKLILDDAYYNTENPKISNTIYDILKDILIKRDAKYIPPIGAKIRNNENRVKLPFWMGSSNKITPNNKNLLDRWYKQNPCETIFISEKLDGVSGIFIQKRGKRKLYTRGNGVTGGDISYIIQYIKNIPNIDIDIAVRGELIIKKDIFNSKYNSSVVKKSTNRLYKNARNMVSGLVGGKTIREGMYNIDFVTYEIIGDNTMCKPQVQFNRLTELGFSVAMNKVIKNMSCTKTLIDIHNTFKQKSMYDIDGIIIQSNKIYDRNIKGNPSYMFAFKVLNDENIYKTKILDIEWSVTSWGQIIPVAIIEPVNIPGCTIKRVTVSNAGLLKDKRIGPNAVINVTRSKEVIPFIVDVLEKCEDLKWPDINYKWDDNNVHILVNNPNKETKSLIEIKSITRFFKSMNIKHINEQTISKLYKNGYNTILKIIRITYCKDNKKLLGIDGIGSKGIERLITNIREGLKDIKLSDIVGSSGILGQGIGKRRVEELIKGEPNIFKIKDHKILKEKIMSIEGFSEIITKKIIDNIDNTRQFILDINKYVIYQTDTSIDNSFKGKKFVFTGFRSKELEKDIENRGGKISTTISKKTTGLIVLDKDNNTSSKYDKAKLLNIPIYTRDEFTTEIL